jgi:large subunit ribosomal protein L4
LHIPLSSLIPRDQGAMRSWKNVVALSPTIFSHPIRRDILHACVVHHLDGLRQGTASTKTRGEVAYSGRKVRPQKGSGKARLGDRGSPSIRGGGVAFGPKPRDFATSLPRKVREMGMRVALSSKVQSGSLRVVESLDWPGVKTNELFKRMRLLGWGKTLFVVGRAEVPMGLRRSSGNLQDVACTTAENLTVYDALKWKTIVLDVEAVDWFENKMGKSEKQDAPPGFAEQ